MSKPQFSKRRKGKKVDTYPLGAKQETGSSKKSRRSRRGRPRHPLAGLPSPHDKDKERRSHRRLRFYGHIGPYDKGIEGPAIEYLTDGQTSGMIAKVYPLTKMDETTFELGDANFYIAKRNWDNAILVRNEETKREWWLYAKETRQGYIQKKRMERLNLTDWAKKYGMIEGEVRRSEWTSKNLSRMIVQDVLVPLKEAGQLKYDYEYSRFTITPPDQLERRLDNECTGSFKFRGHPTIPDESIHYEGENLYRIEEFPIGGENLERARAWVKRDTQFNPRFVLHEGQYYLYDCDPESQSISPEKWTGEPGHWRRSV